MKITIRQALIAVVFMLISAPTFAQQSVPIQDAATYGDNPYGNQSSVTMINNTDMVVYASFVYFDPIDQCWVSRGWRTLQPHGTNVITFGNYSGNVYIHGWQPQGRMNWGNGYTFCCEKTAPFRVLHANGANCEMKRQYTRLTIGAGNTEYSFNP